jgi:hypothetical protein
VVQSHALQDLVGPAPLLGARQSEHVLDEGDVFEDGLARDQPEVLEDDADRTAKVRHLGGGEHPDVASVDHDLAGRGSLLSEEELQERRLAGAGRARQEDELPALDLARHFGQGVPEAAVFLRDVVELDHPSARSSASRTAFGSARPLVFFITWPTNQPKVWVLPER